MVKLPPWDEKEGRPKAAPDCRKTCHCEPVLRLVWQSVLQSVLFLAGFTKNKCILVETDSHGRFASSE